MLEKLKNGWPFYFARWMFQLFVSSKVLTESGPWTAFAILTIFAGVEIMSLKQK